MAKCQCIECKRIYFGHKNTKRCPECKIIHKKKQSAKHRQKRDIIKGLPPSCRHCKELYNFCATVRDGINDGTLVSGDLQAIFYAVKIQLGKYSKKRIVQEKEFGWENTRSDEEFKMLRTKLAIITAFNKMISPSWSESKALGKRKWFAYAREYSSEYGADNVTSDSLHDDHDVGDVDSDDMSIKEQMQRLEEKGQGWHRGKESGEYYPPRTVKEENAGTDGRGIRGYELPKSHRDEIKVAKNLKTRYWKWRYDKEE